MQVNKKFTVGAVITAVVALILIVVFSGSAGAAVQRLIGGKDIKNNSIASRDIQNDSLTLKDAGPVLRNEILNNEGPTGPRGPQGVAGDDGADGQDSLFGAYYATAAYNVGDTNQGAIATVACSNPSDVAIAGGVQMIGVGGNNSAVGSSFPGRMDWTTNTPKVDRLDGWIIQFDADTAPEKVTLWALCVPGATIPVVNTYSQS